jgi:hypothetical protein
MGMELELKKLSIYNLRFLWGAMDFNTKLRKILNGGTLAMRLLAWDH